MNTNLFLSYCYLLHYPESRKQEGKQTPSKPSQFFAMKACSARFYYSRSFALFFGLFLNITIAFTVNPSQSCTTTTTTSLQSSSSETSSSSSSSANMPPKIPLWFQHEITITAPSRGCHLITSDVQKAISSDLSQIRIGMANLFIQHTSASLTINENADPDVRRYATKKFEFFYACDRTYSMDSHAYFHCFIKM